MTKFDPSSTAPPSLHVTVKRRRSTSFLILGASLFVVATSIVGFSVWERYTTTYSYSSPATSVEFLVVPTNFLHYPPAKLEVRVSYQFLVPDSAVIRVRIENGSGVAWAHESKFNSSGPEKETKLDSQWIMLSPGTYSIKTGVSSSYVSAGKIEVVVGRASDFTPLGQLLSFLVLPCSIIGGYKILRYATKPESLIPDLKKYFMTDRRSSLKAAAVLIGAWLLIVLGFLAVHLFYGDLLNLLALGIIILALVLLARASSQIYSKRATRDAWALPRVPFPTGRAYSRAREKKKLYMRRVMFKSL